MKFEGLEYFRTQTGKFERIFCATFSKEIGTVHVSKFGKLNVLVNNAGTTEPWKAIADSSIDDYWRTWTVSIKGTYVMLRTFLPILEKTAKQEKTTVDVINISSIGAHVCQWISLNHGPVLSVANHVLDR